MHRGGSACERGPLPFVKLRQSNPHGTQKPNPTFSYSVPSVRTLDARFFPGGVGIQDTDPIYTASATGNSRCGRFRYG